MMFVVRKIYLLHKNQANNMAF